MGTDVGEANAFSLPSQQSTLGAEWGIAPDDVTPSFGDKQSRSHERRARYRRMFGMVQASSVEGPARSDSYRPACVSEGWDMRPCRSGAIDFDVPSVGFY